MSHIQKLCPNCNTWSNCDQDDKTCQNCGSLFDKNEIIYEDRKRRGLIPKFRQPKPFMEIKSTYPLVLKIVLHIARPIYFVFMFIISAILWFVVWAAA